MSGPRIHPTALVAPGAQLDDDVDVEAYALIGPRVCIGGGSRVGAHTVLGGRTTIGRDNHIFHHASVGVVPQDLKYRGEPSALVLGDGNIVREFATVSIGTAGGGMVTRVGDHNMLMNYSHIAHDCQLGNQVIVANGVQLAGHVIVEDYAVLGALAAVHQFVKIGESAILGAGAMVSKDVPPFCNATGDRARLHGLNLVGLARRGIDPGVVRDLKRAYRIIFRSGLRVAAAVTRARSEIPASPEVKHFLEFIQASERGVCR
ncbi:MAG: acyl-ACP--UDP-N-acetylglucosamine O-acyltransferase [Candidatus Binatia bacterium]